MSKAQRKRDRAKRKLITLAHGETTPQRPTGRDRRSTNQPAEDPRKVVAAQRIKSTGKTDPKEAMAPDLETDMGRCIDALTKGDECRALMDAWGAVRTTHRNYRSLILGNSGEPKGATIAMVAEPMETDQSLRVDIRTEAERIAAANSGWAAWKARRSALPTPQHIWAINAALGIVLGEAVLWRANADGVMGPTAKGRTAVAALRMMIA